MFQWIYSFNMLPKIILFQALHSNFKQRYRRSLHAILSYS